MEKKTVTKGGGCEEGEVREGGDFRALTPTWEFELREIMWFVVAYAAPPHGRKKEKRDDCGGGDLSAGGW